MKLDAILKKTEKKAVNAEPVKKKSGYVSNDRPYDYFADLKKEDVKSGIKVAKQVKNTALQPEEIKTPFFGASQIFASTELPKKSEPMVDKNLNKNTQSSVNVGEKIYDSVTHDYFDNNQPHITPFVLPLTQGKGSLEPGTRTLKTDKEPRASENLPPDRLGENKKVETPKNFAHSNYVPPKVEKKPKAYASKNVPAVSSLVGLQKTVLVFLYQECKKARSQITAELTLSYLSDLTGLKDYVVKKTISRLEEKGFVTRPEFKNGRGGWTKYSVVDFAYQELLIIEKDRGFEPYQPQGEKLRGEVKEVFTNFEANMPDEWLSINIKPLEEIKFTKQHVYQIFKQKILDAQMVQDSIYAFAFDLKNNKKSEGLKLSPTNFFMGILRKGEPYLPPENYESPQERALRLYSQRRRLEEQKKQKQEEEAKTIAFEEWVKETPDEELKSLCPGKHGEDLTSVIAKGYLHKYFNENVWESAKQKIQQEMND